MNPPDGNVHDTSFTPGRWEAIRQNYRQWWDGKLDRPIISITLDGYDPGRCAPELPAQGFQSVYDRSVPAQAIIDRLDYDLRQQRFFGDAFPTTCLNFGPGVVAAFLGAELHNGENTVWFHPREDCEIANLRFRLDCGVYWFTRITELLRAACERWQGQVQVGMLDLGGTIDLLSTFRPSEKLLLDLYDHPEEVKRLTWEAHDAWWQCFEAFDRALKPVNPGYSGWTPIFSETPFYMLQCDFSYMIGREMFDEFVKPELVAACRRLANPFYHLDGQGALLHLDSLLSIPELKGIQWVPGAGAPDVTHWPEVYRKIRAAGKLIQVWTNQSDQGLRIVDILADQLGSAAGLIVIGCHHRDQADETLALLRKYGIERDD